MIKRPFFGFNKPALEIPLLPARKDETPIEAPLPERVALQTPVEAGRPDPVAVKRGDRVKTGQKIPLSENTSEYILSTVTGTISEITESTGYMGKVSTVWTIETEEKDDWDDAFKTSDRSDNAAAVSGFLGSLPGASDFGDLVAPEIPVKSIIVNGIDREPMVNTNRLLIQSDPKGLAEGIRILSEMKSGIEMYLVVPPGVSMQEDDIPGVKIHVIRPDYPNTIPHMIMKDLLGEVPPAGRTPEQQGVRFISAEAVIALGKAMSKGEIPVHKLLTLITKEGTVRHVRARIGTCIGDILKAAGVTVNHGDRLVLGGPMGGQAVYSEQTPILADTDAVMVQDAAQVTENPDIPCVNCGECVRVCPAKIPVNMLIRLLENGLYQDAADEYDLLSCIECGLCSSVCIARIPIFHYIMLGKSELARTQTAEESHA